VEVYDKLTNQNTTSPLRGIAVNLRSLKIDYKEDQQSQSIIIVKLREIIFSPPFEANLYTHFTENNTFENLFGSERSLILP